MTREFILVVDDERDIGALVQEILEDEGFEVVVAESADAAREARRARKPDLILLDIWMPDTDGITLLKEWSENSGPDTPVVMMSGHGSVETAVEATRLGAYDFIEKPLSTAKLLLTVRRALETAQLRQENIGLMRDTQAVSEPAGHSILMQNLRDQAKRIAKHDTPILIIGESGVGKEVLARFIHEHSPRKTGPFVRVPMAGLTNANSAAELFGLEDGERVHYGSLEEANGGTLFLEDVVDMDSTIQPRLLSAIQHQSFLRVGGVEPIRINVRIIAATSRDIVKAVKSGQLRDDLYYHLNVVPIEVPSLRNHREDIPELVEYYVDVFANKENLPYRRFSVGALNRLRNYSWPGNIRELKNLVQRLLILGSGGDVEADEIDAAVSNAISPQRGGELEGLDLPLKAARERFERAYLERQLRIAGGNVSQVAARAGLERTHLYRKLKSLGIDPKAVATEQE
ncbi:MAG: sigma-54 dependent transcriptional regulator [Gammaproteobacteria bacterium]|nr:sigma-54 dependent transcriptional regulator [Gammaproteobacteria bacterium]MDH3412355.1 sigma-54 dependent transcriptional regulator [Gammaproteobacteria bacterium]